MTTQIHFPSQALNQGGWGARTDDLRSILGWKHGDPIYPTATQCFIRLKGDAVIRATAVGDHIFIDSQSDRYNYQWEFHGIAKVIEKTDKPFVFAEVEGNAFVRDIRTADPNSRDRSAVIMVRHTYDAGETRPAIFKSGQYDRVRRTGEQVPYAYLSIKITAEDGATATGELHFHQPTQGTATIGQSIDDPTVHVETEFYGMLNSRQESLQIKTRVETSRDYWRSSYSTTYTEFSPLATLIIHTHGSALTASKDEWWLRFFRFNSPTTYWDNNTHQFSPVPLDMDGLTAAMKKKGVKENLERLEKESTVDFTFFQWLMNGKTVDKRKNNSMLAAMLAKIGHDYNLLRDALRNCRLNTIPTDVCRDVYHSDPKQGMWFKARREFCLQLPGVKELVEEQEAKADWTKRRDNGSQADGLGITAATAPLLRAAIEAGQIPTGVFVQPGSGNTDRTPVNIEFDLWEKALGRGWGETLSKIAHNASARTTYERDISPFLAFCFKIEKFLKKHTGHKWVAQPSFVESQWQLEMEETDDAKATVKKRSALTPVADNETFIVTVPYVALAVSGVRTQWCYSRHYHLFEEGFTDPISGGIVTKDFEPKLNGRDDYGLCYYTLTGTDTARGYPTFLIIFERLASETRVHFHRVHPHRSKKGVLTHASKMIEGCYQYMAGNIPATDITTQQGDLIFIRLNSDPTASAAAKTELVTEGQAIEFESHSFIGVQHRALVLYGSKAKEPKNRLGFLKANTSFRVEHPEHENIPNLSEGWWEIRRCKSWEANPKAIWSRTID